MNYKGTVIRIFGVFLFLSIAWTLQGQIEEVATDTVIEKKKRLETRWLMLDVGYAGWAGPGFNTQLQDSLSRFQQGNGWSMHWNFQIFQQRVNLIQDKFNILYGFSMDFHRYSLSQKYALDGSGTTVVQPLSLDTFNVLYSRFNTFHFTVPLMLNYESHPDRKLLKSFRISLGAYGSMNLGAKARYKTVENGKVKDRGEFYVSTLRYGLLGEIGFGPATFYGRYGLSPFFASVRDNGYVMYPFEIGLKLGPYW